MRDVQIIDKLNAKLRRPLKQVKSLTWFLKGYIVNAEGYVTHVNIFKSQLKGEFPEEIFQLSHLQHLDIRENELENIPDEIGNLVQLNFLDIRFNQLKALPDTFARLDSLERAYLGQNAFETVPNQIGLLKSLSFLDMSESKITDGCEILLNAPQLRNIYLNNNQITYFPFERLKSNHLDELFLFDNPLLDRPEAMTGKIKKLVCQVN